MGDPRSPDMLAEVATGHATHTFVTTRVNAARKLAELGNERGIWILADITDEDGSHYGRLDAAEALGQLGDARGRESLTRQAASLAEYPGHRVAAARALGKLGDRAAATS